MNENKTITLTLDEYETLIRAQERIEVVERIINTLDYINVGEIAAVLGIREKTVGGAN